ncbi:glycosyltransferase [Piscibacillus sp. B03]|uniref:glycosyltransferase n=1 Tax=Piscibacillus sp. B03 TaxID=3457430 RepID=UPI003FCDE2D4
MRSSKKVVHLTSVHHPYDPRIYHKECLSLHEAGYDVTLIAQEAPEGQKETPIKHIPINSYSSKLKRMIQGSWEVYRIAKKEKADVYHFHDPELMMIAWLLKNKRNTVVYDIHEDFVTSLIKKDYLKKSIKRLIKISFRTIEGFFTKNFKKVLAEKYYSEIYPEGHWVLNYPTVNEQFLQHDRSNQPIEKKLLYTGNVDVQRGAHIHPKIPNIHQEVEVHFIGKCPSRYANEMKEIAGDHQDRIHITGIDRFVEKEDIEQAYLSRNWLAGIALFPPTEHYLKKELTKFFEYMNAGLPIICSNFDRWKEIIDQYQCGIAVDPYDETAIHDAIEYLIQNPNEARQMGLNGKKAVQEQLNWQTQANRLIELYDEWTT